MPVVEIMPRIDDCRKQNHYWSTCLLLTICLLFSSVILFYSANAFDPNATKYVFVKKWGSRGTGDGQFSLPVTIIMDSKGNLIVNERGNSRVQKFDSNGTFLLKFGSAGKGDGQFTDPEHLAIDSDGNVYVTDRKTIIYRYSNL